MNIMKKIHTSDEIDSQHVCVSGGYHTRGWHCTCTLTVHVPLLCQSIYKPGHVHGAGVQTRIYQASGIRDGVSGIRDSHVSGIRDSYVSGIRLQE